MADTPPKKSVDLRSKPLPGDRPFDPDDSLLGAHLRHDSAAGEFSQAGDSIVPSFTRPEPHPPGSLPDGRASIREPFIDVTRGLFLFWMLTAHALTVCSVGPESWLFYLRPPGWSTTGFITLSGFGVAWAFIGRGMSGRVLRQRLGRRALQLLGWAVLTEAFSRVAVDWLSGGATASGLVDVARPWSISEVLVPTSFLLGMLALMAPHLGAPYLLPLVAGLAAAAAVVASAPLPPAWAQYLTWLLGGGVIGFPAMLMVVLGFVGVGLGLASRKAPTREFLAGLMTFGLACLAAHAAGWRLNVLYPLATFSVSLGLGGLITALPVLALLRRGLKLLGGSALMVFVVHRFVMQFGIRLVPTAGRDGLSVIPLLGGTVGVLLALCLAKEGLPGVRQRLRSIGM